MSDNDSTAPSQAEIANALFGLEATADPWSVLARIRQHFPVYRNDEFHSILMTRADDVAAVLRDPHLWSDPRRANPDAPIARLGRENGGGEPSMLFADNPRHKRLRSLVAQAFTPKSIEAWRERTAEVARELLSETGDSFDLIGDFAGPLPTIVISEIMGVDPSLRDWFKHCSDATAYAFFNPLCSEEERNEGMKCGDELSEYFHGQIAARRAAPNDDLIAAMVTARVDDDALSDEEIADQCNLLLIAGNITTTDLIGNGVQALLSHRSQWDKLCAQPQLVQNAVEEILRFCPPVMNSGRIANEDTSMSGCPVHQGDALGVSLAAANRDPHANPDPDSLDIERERPKHWSFGGGRHFCLGAPLARMEAQEALLALTARYPNLRLADDEQSGQLRTMPGFRGYLDLQVRAD